MLRSEEPPALTWLYPKHRPVAVPADDIRSGPEPETIHVDDPTAEATAITAALFAAAHMGMFWPGSTMDAAITALAARRHRSGR